MFFKFCFRHLSSSLLCRAGVSNANMSFAFFTEDTLLQGWPSTPTTLFPNTFCLGCLWWHGHWGTRHVSAFCTWGYGLRCWLQTKMMYFLCCHVTSCVGISGGWVGLIACVAASDEHHASLLIANEDYVFLVLPHDELRWDVRGWGGANSMPGRYSDEHHASLLIANENDVFLVLPHDELGWDVTGGGVGLIACVVASDEHHASLLIANENDIFLVLPRDELRWDVRGGGVGPIACVFASDEHHASLLIANEDDVFLALPLDELGWDVRGWGGANSMRGRFTTKALEEGKKELLMSSNEKKTKQPCSNVLAIFTLVNMSKIL